ncbi:MAG: MotA/TolQ/ExbB proton channel family protein [Candidatus Poribacteria bacterium]|nr:MotA/TolQ/ExbB proton channel family protein [Candidatus Poribacteria bacterium]
MNLSTLIGVLVGFVVLATAIYLQVEESQLSALVFWSRNSLLIVLGGVIAATFISYPLRDVLSVLKGLRLAITRDELPVINYIHEIEALSGEALRRGSSRLKGAADEVGNYFLEDGLRMVIDRYSAEDIREIMADQINHTYQREMGEAKIFRTMAKLSPAFGVVGTLIGLIIMMKGLDPEDTAKMMSTLGSGMATALLTTFYGILLSNLIFLPIALKVEKRIEERVILMNIIMEGTLLILEKTPPTLVQDRLKVFLPPRKWASIKQRGEAK